MEKELKEMTDYYQKRANVFHGRGTIFFIILFGLAAFTGCKSDKSKNEEVKIEVPDNFKLISKSKTDFGNIYKFTCDNDTLYISEGKNSTYPISMTIKN